MTSSPALAPLLTAPKRRDVKALTAALADVRPGDHIAAVFRDERYGTYRITGTLTTTVADDAPALAGVVIAPRGKPHPTIVLVEQHLGLDAEPDAEPAPDGGDRDGATVQGADPIEDRVQGALDGAAVHQPGIDVDPTTVTHGELVTAHFSCPPWGDFEITGHAVALGTSAVMVGGWLLNTDHSLTTYPGARVTAARLHRADLTDATAPERAHVLAEA